MRLYPALDVSWPAAPDDDMTDRLVAELDGAGPTAVEPRPFGIRIFFATAGARDDASAIASRFLPTPRLESQLVSDEDWAARSQAGLSPVRVGRLLVVPEPADGASEPAPSSADIVIAIRPSMGFGTGHHASTRLCLGLLQKQPLTGRRVLDVGTGSGVLAIAAWRLGAIEVMAIDVDEDALQSASDNLVLNQVPNGVTLRRMDLSREAASLGTGFDVVLANLTGAMIEREARTLAARMTPGGVLVGSGFETHEEAAVTAAFAQARMTVRDRDVEETWTALLFEKE
jgi:ribosomal protein L11 methyltransferase